MTVLLLDQAGPRRVRSHEVERLNSSNSREIVLGSNLQVGDDKKSHSVGSRITFVPPGLVCYTREGAGAHQLIYGTPMSSTSCRVFVQYVRPLSTRPTFHSLLVHAFRAWSTHRIHNWILDGDMVFLNAQSRRMRSLEEEGKGWASEYFMPGSCDVGVTAFRRCEPKSNRWVGGWSM